MRLGNNPLFNMGKKMLTIILVVVILLICLVVWLIKKLFWIGLIIGVIAVVLYVINAIVSGKDTKSGQNYYIDENGVKIYTKSDVENKNVNVVKKTMKCSGCGTQLSSSTTVCPVCKKEL